MSSDLRLLRLHCVRADDSPTDEVKMQQDGRQFWPNSGDGFFSMSTGNEVALNILRHFDGDSTTISLFDDETFGSDDRLGSATIFRSESGTGDRRKDIVGSGAHYILTYRVRDNGDF